MKKSLLILNSLMIVFSILGCSKSNEKISEKQNSSTGMISINVGGLVNSNKSESTSQSISWTDAPSLKEAFVDSGYFDRFGIACELNEIGNKTTAKGLAYQANSTTPGNECKPQFIFWYPKPAIGGSYTDSTGKTITVPTNLNFAAKMDPYLKAVSAAGLQMRGHVLVWHSQTPEWFFTKNYEDEVIVDANGVPTNLADKATMLARQEWYIKSVLEHVAEWEEANGYAGKSTEKESGKKHLIYAWDVVNEAAADDATKTNYLRGDTPNTKNKAPNAPNGNGSRWYQIFGDDTFITNAFRLANAYAPSDVLLAYNDYNCYLEWTEGYKTSAICSIVKSIQNAPAKKINGKLIKPRIDIIGMQSHVGETYPTLSGVETAIKTLLNLGLDIHITEFDMATKKKTEQPLFKQYFKLFMKYSKNKGTTIKGHGITGVTVWGINDENSWIGQGGQQFPLLFTKKGSKYMTKDCFYDLINLTK